MKKILVCFFFNAIEYYQILLIKHTVRDRPTDEQTDRQTEKLCALKI